MHRIAHEWLPGHVPYREALELQEQHVIDLREGRKPEHLFLLEHAPVYTIGRTRDQSSLNDSSHLPYPVEIISRGGQATYHGPGQLTGYPILDMNNRARDLHAYMRALEEAIILTSKHFGVNAARRDQMTGVWCQNRKLASIGVGVRKWIVMHGFAFNIEPQSLPPFESITPCGIDGVRMTCLSVEAGKAISVKEAGEMLAYYLPEALYLNKLSRVT